MALWLVTGGCGFIGSHLVDALAARGDTVRVLDDLSTGKRFNLPSGADLIVADVADRDTVAQAMNGVDGCFHLAAVASVQRGNEDWLGTHRTNLTGTISIFDAARASGGAKPIPVAYASSAAIYGDNPNVPLAEVAEPSPLTAYGSDKLGCELHARVAWHVHGTPTIGLRFFNVYGPRQDSKSSYSGVIATFANRALAGQAIYIHGDGRQVRDFIYVADVVHHLLAAMAKLQNQEASGAAVFNVCTGRATSVLGLAQLIAAIAGTEIPIIHCPPRTGDIRTSIGNPALAALTFGFAANTDIRCGLERTLASSTSVLEPLFRRSEGIPGHH